MPLPPQTKYIVGNEACERFSFYGMRSILTLYMVNILAMSEQAAVTVVHLFIALIYILPLLGAWLADRFLGRYRIILYVSMFYCVGHGVLALADLTEVIEIRRYILFTGLFIIAIGAGGIKPCVSAFVGDQVQQGESKTMTRIYAAFYWSINLGSFFGILITPWISQNWDYSWAFAIPGIFMGLATLIFWCGRRYYHHRQPSQPAFFPSLGALMLGRSYAAQRFDKKTLQETQRTLRHIGFFTLLALGLLAALLATTHGISLLVKSQGGSELASSLCSTLGLLAILAGAGLLALKIAADKRAQGMLGIYGCMLYRGRDTAARSYPAQQLRSARNLLRIIVVFLMIIPFWSLFDQTATSWVLQGKAMSPIIVGDVEDPIFKFGAEEMQSFNPLLVMILVPLVTLLVYPYIGKWGAPLKRMGCGIVLAGISYGAVASIQWVLDSGTSLSILWQCIPYLLLTISEILVSTTGLEYAYTAAGKNLKSIISGFWFLTSTMGNFLVIYLTHLVSNPVSVSAFLMYGSLSVVIGLIFLYVTTRPAMIAEQEG